MNSIEVSSLTKSFKQKQVLKGLRLNAPEGKIYGFLGPNGSGKTTTIKILMGLILRDGGKASLLNHNIDTITFATRNRIGYLPQDPVFPKYYTGWEVIEFVSQIYRMNTVHAKKRGRELLEAFALYQDKDRQVSAYSKGMKQKLGLAVVLLPELDLVLLDEPTSALDPEGRTEILHIIKEMQGKMTALLSSHILTDIEKVCDRVGIIYQGETLVESDMQALLDQYLLPTYILKVRSGYEQKTLEVLRNMKGIHFQKEERGIFRIWTCQGLVNEIEEKTLMELFCQGIIISEFYREKADLEKVFLEIIHQYQEHRREQT